MSAPDTAGRAALLEVTDLTVSYRTRSGDVTAVEGVSFTLGPGESLGLVGESGCGKTTLALSLLRLLPANALVRSGSIRLGGVELLSLSEAEMRRRRWNDLALVFQGAMNSWNPVYALVDQIHEAINAHARRALRRPAARARVAELFELVGLPSSAMDRYPHECSGGMRQRAVIAMALACQPRILIADEPTTAVDVIVQDRILRRLGALRRDLGLAVLHISHDLAVIAQTSDRVGVMYAGELVEVAPTVELFRRPRHPYTWSLMRSTPSIDGPPQRLPVLRGEPPDLRDPPSGCRFRPRCFLATERCKEAPPLDRVADGHHTACWHWPQVPPPHEDGRLG